MTTTLYSSTDAGALAAGVYLTSSPGSLLTILDACLVNGYAGKAAAGWSKPYAGTNIGVYRAGQGNQRYLQVNDTTARYALVTGYESMSGVNTGSGPFPNVVGSGQSQLHIIKTGNESMTATPRTIAKIEPALKKFTFAGNVVRDLNMPIDEKFVVVGNTDAATNGIYTIATVAVWESTGNTTYLFVREVVSPTAANDGTLHVSYRPQWLLVATEKSFIFWSNWEYTATPSFPSYGAYSYFFGDFQSHRAGDQFNTTLIAQQDNSVGNINNLHTCDNIEGAYIARPFTQLGSSIRSLRTPHSGVKFSTASGYNGTAGIPYPNPIDGNIVLSPIWVTDGSNQSPYIIRGVLPGVWWCAHSYPFTHGQIINGSGGLAGKTLMAWTTYNGGNQLGQMLIEISNTW